jgi:hypothetical protein
LTCFTSPRIAAICKGVSPRSFLLLTLSFCRDEELGVFFGAGVVCEGWFGVESVRKKKVHKNSRLFYILIWNFLIIMCQFHRTWGIPSHTSNLKLDLGEAGQDDRLEESMFLILKMRRCR